CSLAVCVSVAAVPSGAPPTKPAGDIEPLARGPVDDALFAASFDGAQGIAAGAAGELRTSSDGGKTWRTEKLDTQGLSLLGVAALGGRQIAVGQQGMVFTRADGAWTPGKSGTQQRLFSVAMHRSGLALTVGAFGTLLRSTDAGA
ncbi:UNVERIFIED_CONTAM: photosystem II stability/assembly factor-like protein, partial [Salmonella enterica subsp. enterica serovar Weltevreden]